VEWCKPTHTSYFNCSVIPSGAERSRGISCDDPLSFPDGLRWGGDFSTLRARSSHAPVEMTGRCGVIPSGAERSRGISCNDPQSFPNGLRCGTVPGTCFMVPRARNRPRHLFCPSATLRKRPRHLFCPSATLRKRPRHLFCLSATLRKCPRHLFCHSATLRKRPRHLFCLSATLRKRPRKVVLPFLKSLNY
jgi:hypothetical protein